MSNEVIILSDIPNQSKETYAGRYAGPYVIKSALKNAGYKAIVLDWFRFLPDDQFFNYIEKLVSKDTLVIAISTTFLVPSDNHHKIGDSSGYNTDVNKSIEAQTLYLWEDSNNKLTKWFEKLNQIIKSKSPKCKIILGGGRTNRILQMSELAGENYCIANYCDMLFCGMADKAIVEYVKGLKYNQPINPTIVKNNIKFLICNNKYNSKNIVPRTIYGIEDCFEKQHWAPLEVSRGCAFNCKFCYYDKRSFNKRSMSCLKEELIYNYNELGINHYNITSDCFNDNRQFVNDWATMVTKLPFKIEWVSYARIDPFHKYPEMIDEMLESGYRAGWYGIETFCRRAGRAVGKGLDPDKVKELLYLLRKKGGKDIWTTAYFIIGLPHETEKSLNETLEWLMNQNIIDEVQTSILDIAPFIEELDGIVDFSEQSRNPNKFGFTELTFSPEFYWKHDTLDLFKAREINEQWRKAFEEHTFTRFGGSAHGEYVRIRDTGLSHKETVVFMKTKFLSGKKIINVNVKNKRIFKDYVKKLSKENIQRYYDKFLLTNGVKHA